jgi:hypothetical protein
MFDGTHSSSEEKYFDDPEQVNARRRPKKSVIVDAFIVSILKPPIPVKSGRMH